MRILHAPPSRSTPWLATLCAAVLAFVLAACSTPQLNSTQQVAELTRLIREKDFNSATSLIKQYPDSLDDRRALSVAVRVGDVEAVRFFAQRVGVDAPLDLDATTALIDSITRTPPQARLKVAGALLEMGADPDREDKFGRTAGALAERRNETEVLGLMERYSPIAQASASKMMSWFPKGHPVTLVADASPGGARALVQRMADERRESERRRGPNARNPNAPVSPAFLMRTIWLPSLERSGPGPFAGFRFHADGTGQLLRYMPLTRKADPVADSSVAWTYERDKLRFFVLSGEFSALCEGDGFSSSRFEIRCTDYTRVVNRSGGTRAETTGDDARVLLERPPSLRVSILRNSAAASATMQSSAEPGCVVKPTAKGARPAGLRPGTSGDWYGFSPSRLEAASPLSGMACKAAESERAAMIACGKNGARDCQSVSGCPSGQVSAIAAVKGHGTAWVGCDLTVADARRKALEACEANAGCDCQLIAVNGNNLNLARQAVCSR